MLNITTLEAFVTTVNDLGIELIINEALRRGKKTTAHRTYR